MPVPYPLPMDAERTSTMNISLPESLRDFVQARVAQRYSSVSEYIRELVRADERRARQEKAEEALASGLANPEFDQQAVREAIDGLRSLRQELADRGVRMSADEIRAALDEGRR